MAALRRALASPLGRQLAATWRPRYSSSVPRVADHVISLTAIDRDGTRHVIKGLAGQSLLRALIRSKIETAERNPSEEIGSCYGNDEVTIATDWLEKIPPPSNEELDVLRSVSSNGTVNSHSRLGSQIILTKELDGMTVALAESRPYYTL